jgi:NADH-quinone oxidoreductase subunit L
VKFLWFLPILNIVAFVCTFFFAKKLADSKAQVFTIPAIAVSWIVSFWAMIQAISTPKTDGARELLYESASYSVQWFDFGAASLRLGVHVDGFAITMLMVVCTISLMMQIYSISYMRGEIRYVTYYAVVALFSAGMMILVLADTLFLAIFGWEIMGLCSYLLIGHYHEKKANAYAAMKAFFTTRTGDIGLLLGTFTVFWATGTFNIAKINELAFKGEFAGFALEATAVLLFIAVIGKSAQFPLHTWLPDAMAGPTPASSLIHAATMVVAGVYLVARLFPVYVEAFDIGEVANSFASVHLVATVGAVTAIVAALIALVQFDLKKVLAYSTISQLGFMVFGLGVGAWGAAVFHLVTHAAFKALLFLGAGSVIHAVHTNDMREMGGLRKHMSKTYWTWIIGTLALAGIFPLSGFFSKDEILAGAFKNGYAWVWAIGSIVAFLTAFYMFRATHMTFHGSYRGKAHPHESDSLVTSPLIILAGITIVIGWFGLPGQLNLFDGFAEPEIVEKSLKRYGDVLLHKDALSKPITYILALSSLAIAGLGILFATMLFLPKWRDRFAGLRNNATETWLKPARTLLENKLYLDKLYGGLTLWIRDPLSDAAYWFNQNVIDAVINGTAKATVEAGKGAYFLDQRGIDAFYNGLGTAAQDSGSGLRRTQTGKVQQYAGVIVAAVAVIALVLLFVPR